MNFIAFFLKKQQNITEIYYIFAFEISETFLLIFSFVHFCWCCFFNGWDICSIKCCQRRSLTWRLFLVRFFIHLWQNSNSAWREKRKVKSQKVRRERRKVGNGTGKSIFVSFEKKKRGQLSKKKKRKIFSFFWENRDFIFCFIFCFFQNFYFQSWVNRFERFLAHQKRATKRKKSTFFFFFKYRRRGWTGINSNYQGSFFH